MYKDGFSLPGLSENILFQFSQQDFSDYLKQEPDVDTSSYTHPKNIDEKIKDYKQQDRKAKRSLSNYITQAEIIDLFIKQKYVCHYCWTLSTVYNWSLDRIDCSKAHISGNCIIACVKCNKQRKDTLMEKFYRKKALLRFAKTHPMIHLIDNKNKRVFYKIKNHIVGGPSIVYHRYHEKGVTKIDRVHYNKESKEWYYNGDGKVVHSIVGFDANALYLSCLGQDMLCGKLEWIPTKDEYKNEYDTDSKDLSDEERQKYETERKLDEASRNLQEYLEKIMQTNNQKILEFVETFFGLVKIDIEIPEDQYEKFGEMPPIFKNIQYSEEESGEYMKKIILGINEKLSTSRKLIASLKATRILVKSTQLKWLLEKGAIITKLYGVIPAQRGKPFKDFVEWVSDERRKGDRDTRYAVIAEAAKTVGNSALWQNRNEQK